MKIVLVGNYAPDRQQSMLRYAEMLRTGLLQAGCEVELVAPRATVNPAGAGPVGASKWLGYLDKYVLGVVPLGRAMRKADVVHICDHSNAVYVPRRSLAPCVVTCHDLLAVRGALGENTDCPASWLGTHLQKQILSGLRRANAVACVSGATLDDARRLLGDRYPGRLTIIPNALNHPYRPLDETEWTRRIAKLPDMPAGSPYLLLVGTNLRRKNRDVAVRALAKVADRWPGLLVCAGEPLDDELRARASRLGVSGRIVDVPRPDNDTLEALYSGARALIFPSRFEGFGWPIIEAHAAGCPVICSDRPPLPEVAGDAAILCGADDVDAFANAILRLEENPPERARLQRLGHANLARFDRAIVVGQLLQLYADLRRAV